LCVQSPYVGMKGTAVVNSKSETSVTAPDFLPLNAQYKQLHKQFISMKEGSVSDSTNYTER